MTLTEVLQDIYGLDERLRVLERNYGLLSEDLYALYRLGELEQTKDLIRWVGYYEMRQERQAKKLLRTGSGVGEAGIHCNGVDPVEVAEAVSG